MPVPCIAAGACFTATMAALGDCNVDVSHGIDVEEGRINNDQDADAEGRSPTKRSSSVQFQGEALEKQASRNCKNTSIQSSISTPISVSQVASVRSILAKMKARGDRKTSIRKSDHPSLMDEESVTPYGFIQGDFHSAKVMDVNTLAGAWTMAYHPEGASILAVGLMDGEGVVLYETQTYSEIYILEREDTVSALAWLPMEVECGHSTSLLAVACLDGTVAVYKMQVDLIELQGVDLFYEYRCNSQVRCMTVVISDHSVLLAVGEKIGTITFFALSFDGTRAESWNVDQHDSAVLGLVISHSGSLLAACTKGGDVTVRRIHREKVGFRLGADLWHTKRNGPLRSILFSNDDSRLVFGGYDKKVVLVDTNLWDVVRELNLEGTINTVSYDKLGRYLAVGCRDNSFTLFDTSTFFPIKSIHTPGWVTCVSWGNVSSSGDFVAVRSEETCISILDLTPIHKVNVKLTSERDNNASLSWSIDGRFLARIKGKTILIADSRNEFNDVASLELSGVLKSVAFCPAKDRGNSLACVSLDGQLALLQLICKGSRFYLEIIKSVFLEENLCVLAWIPDASLIATGGRGKKLFLVSSNSMLPLMCTPLEIEGQIWAIDFMPQAASLHAGGRANSYSMAVGSSDCVATLYDIGNRNPTLRVMRPRPVRCLTYHPLLPILAIGDGGNIVSILDILGEETSHEVTVGGRVNALAFSPSGDFLVIGSDDCRFTFHETIGFRIVQEIKVNGFALSTEFSGSSGQYLALGNANNDYSVFRLGPFLGTDMIPLESSGGIDHLPTWAFNEALYRSGDGPSIVQRNMIEGSQASLRRAATILQDHPDAIYAFDRSTGDGCFQTALKLKKPNLLKLVMTTLVDGTLETDSNGRRTILTSEMPELGLDTLQHIIANFPPQYIVDILAEMTYIKVPFTEPREVSTSHIKECGSSSYADPWDLCAPRRGISRSEHILKFEDDDTKEYVYRTPAVLPLPGLGSSKFLSSLLNGAPPTVFDNAAMGIVLHVMWEQFIRPYFLFDLSIFLLYYLLWTVVVDWTSSTTSASSDSLSGIKKATPMCLIVLNTVFAVKEIIQSNFGRSKGYYRSIWNAVDVLSIVMVYIYAGSTLFQGGFGSGNVPLAVFTTLLLTLKLLSYLRGFDSTGWLISVLLQNFRDVRGFILVLLVMLFGFTTSFRLLFGDVQGVCQIQVDTNGEFAEQCSVNPYSSIGRAFLATFALTVLGSYTDGFLDASKYTPLAVLIVIVAVVSVLVVALNALIAVLSDSYARVQEKAVANRRKERAALIVEYLSILPPPKRREIEKNTRYFHALLEADEDGDLLVSKDDWQGGLIALRRDLEEMNAHSAELNHQAMDEWKASIDNDIAALRREVISMLEDVSRDLKELRRVQKEGGVTFNGSNVAKAVRAVKSIGNRGLFGVGNDT